MSTELLTPTESVVLTRSAARQLRKLIDEEGATDRMLRIGVKGGGCSGMSYILAFDIPTDMDVHLEQDGVVFIVDKRHLLYLGGTELDFSDGLDNRGFVFSNPNATSTCGCGSSFSA
jgi:iron-sulfur cluster assembly protein